MIAALSRRTVLQGMAAGAAVGSTRLSAATSQRPDSVLVIDPAVPAALGRQMGDRHPNATVVALEADVVRHWRGTLRGPVVANGGALAVVPWAQARILAELVREAGGASDIQHFHGRFYQVELRTTRA